MPLEHGSSKSVVSRNISEMVHAGHPQNQAVAAAMRAARQSRQEGGETNRVPQLVAGAKQLSQGAISGAQYGDLVRQFKPVRPYAEAPPLASRDDLVRGLSANKHERIGKLNEYPEGHPVSLRLDIPAYTHHGVWSPTIHDSKTKKPISYEPAAHITDAEFGLPEQKAMRVAMGEAKSPFAAINGRLVKQDPAETHELVRQHLNDPEWAQVGMDPERHSYFYDRRTEEPIVSAQRVLQSGPVVLAHKPVYGRREDHLFAAGGAVATAMRAARQGGGETKSKPQTYFEVAPGKTWDAVQQRRWEKLHPSAKADISGRMIDEFLPRWQKDTGITGEVKGGLGGFEGSTNPNFTFEPHDPSRLAEATNSLGHLFRQDSMMAAHEDAFPGSMPAGVVRVHLPHAHAPEEIHDLYKQLHDQGLAEGHSTDPLGGTMDITLPGASGDEAEAHARKVDAALGGQYNVSSGEGHVAFPEHGADYGVSGTHPEGAGTPLAQAENSVQQQARTRLQALIAEAHRQGGGHQGPVDLNPKAPARISVDKPVAGRRYPGIYGNPRELVAEAASRVAPESPHLKRIFGVTRAEMYERGAHRVGNVQPVLPFKGSGKNVNEAAARIMTRRNAQRLQDILHEASQHEGLRHGMMAWYYMDPAFDALKHQVGHEEAVRRYSRLNTLMGMQSPGSEVETEINRGAALNYLAHQGRIEDYIRHGGTAEHLRGGDFPADLTPMKAHAYHSTSHTTPIPEYLRRGDLSGMGSVKVPTYVGASGVPETGFQTDWAVPDAHLTRAVGMGDTRSAAGYGASMSPTEYRSFAPWWRKDVAGPMGMQAVPGQGLLWGAASGATGVTSPIGAPKLELLANHIAGVAQRRGISPEQARDQVLKGEIYARGGRVARAEGGPLLFHSNLHGGHHLHTGPIHSHVAGRTDHLPIHVPSGSYVLPADVVSSHGEGNTIAGFKVMRRLFGGGPYGSGKSGPYGQGSGPYGEELQNRAFGGEVRGKKFYFHDNIGQGTLRQLVDSAPPMKEELSGEDRKIVRGLAHNGKHVWWHATNAIHHEASKALAAQGYDFPARYENRLEAERDKNGVLQINGGTNDGGVSQLPQSFMDRHQKWQANESAKALAAQREKMFGGSDDDMVGIDDPNFQSRGGRATDHGDGVPIVAAGGEYVLSPDQVRAAGNGDPELGCRILDGFVKASRAKHIQTLKGLPGPAKD